MLSILIKRNIFALILVLILALFAFTKNTNAAGPPLGCTCPGPGGTCVGGGSYWVSATQYKGYYYCRFTDSGCPGSASGWNAISRTAESLDSHGCDSPACSSGGCAVTGILWEQIPAPTCTLTATPSVLGGAITTSNLSWTATNINLATDTAIISNSIDATTITVTTTPGNKDVTPTVNTVYTLTVNNGTTATCSATVTVCAATYGNACTSAPNACGQTNSGTIDCLGACTAVAPPNSDCPSCNISSAPNSINISDSSLLSWTTANSIAGGTSIDNGIGVVAIPSGSQSVSPVVNTTYTMTVNAATGTSGTCTATVSINAPTCTLSSSESAVLPNDTVILSWTATNATSGTINGVSATPIASGSMTSPPIAAPTAFTMSVSGPGGTGTCGPVNVQSLAAPIGGLVPCGRAFDDPNTAYDETDPCTLCHIFIMLQMIATFIVEMGGIIAIFFLVIGGLIYSTSAGDQGRMETGKKAIMWALFGLAIILLSWLIVTIVLTAFGYINPLGGQWNIVNCSV